MRRNIKLVDALSGKELIPNLEATETKWEATVGLLGKKSLADNEALFIKSCSSIHTFFMKFSISLYYVDKDFNIIKIVSNVKPWRISFCPSAYGVFEIPVGAEKVLKNINKVAIISHC